MTKTHSKLPISYARNLLGTLKMVVLACWYALKWYWQSKWWHKLVVVTIATALVTLGGMYGIARWYIATSNDKPLVIGTSFIPAYAESLGVDPQETMDALIDDLGVRHFRLVSYWSQLEPEEGKYDFSLLDWQFKKAEDSSSKVTLSIGLRQPRWPECHMPNWAAAQPTSQWEPKLKVFMTQVIERYKHSPALDSYQLENEFFLKGFGTCKNWDRDRLVAEYNLVKQLDTTHKVIISRSNNALGWPVGEPTPDEFGISIYKRVWDATLTKRYLEYPFPAWYYAFVAGWQKIMTGQDMIIHELQAESWGPKGQHLSDISLSEANKSFNAERFRHRVEFGRGTGMREIYLWGSEYWYYRMVVKDDPSLWRVAQDIYRAPR
jgi:hypothetical protein